MPGRSSGRKPSRRADRGLPAIEYHDQSETDEEEFDEDFDEEEEEDYSDEEYDPPPRGRKGGKARSRGGRKSGGGGSGGGIFTAKNIILAVCWLALVGAGIAGTIGMLDDDDEGSVAMADNVQPGSVDEAAFGGDNDDDDEYLESPFPSPPNPSPPPPPSPPKPCPPPPSPRPPPPPSPPHPPPSPPHPNPIHPPAPPPAGPIVDQINARFSDFTGADSDSRKAGVLLHHFDNQGNSEKPWMPCPELCWGKKCWCADIRDRVSASMINAKLPKHNGRMPTYTDVDINAASGLVLNPGFSKILCAYPSDGGSAGRTCDPIGVSANCVPGCYNFDREGGGQIWCDDSGGAPNCAYRPTNMVEMLASQRDVSLAGGLPMYNEVIIDRTDWQSYHPKGIDAVWFMKFSSCRKQDASMLCENYARRIHSQLKLQYGLDDEMLPLLMFDPTNFDAPFTRAPKQ